MISDQTTFFLAFAAVFLGITFLLLRLERRTDRLTQQVAAQAASVATNEKSSAGPADDEAS